LVETHANFSFHRNSESFFRIWHQLFQI
jgi:hypothetical protein